MNIYLTLSIIFFIFICYNIYMLLFKMGKVSNMLGSYTITTYYIKIKQAHDFFHKVY
jgi:hypothetical protein